MRVILPTLLFTLLVVACNRQPIKTLFADVKQPTLSPETVQSLISSLSSENEVRKPAEKTSREEAIKQIVIETAPPKK